ncbi:MAG: phosphoribosyltransferase family protein [bacterium]
MDRSILEREGAILSGHFLLTSGRHSDVYFEKFRLLENPDILTALVSEIIDSMEDVSFDYVAGPATGGMITAYEFARQLSARSAYIEKRDSEMGFFRDTPIGGSDSILVVDDVLTTGKSLIQSIEAIKRVTKNIKAAAVLIDRSSELNLQYPLYRGITVEAESYSAHNCPLCKQGIELIRPGGKR